MPFKKNWNSNGNIKKVYRLQLLGFCLGQTYSTSVVLHVLVVLRVLVLELRTRTSTSTTVVLNT